MSETVGEKLVKKYFKSHNFDYKKIEETADKTPDFHICKPAEFLLEVKDIYDTPEVRKQKAGINSYTVETGINLELIRRKIGEAREQFKPYKDKELPCVLLIYANPMSAIDVDMIKEAMYGRLEIRVPVDLGAGIPANAKTRTVYGEGGKVVRSKWSPHGLEKQDIRNTTFSAVGLIREKEKETILCRLITFVCDIGRLFVRENGSISLISWYSFMRLPKLLSPFVAIGLINGELYYKGIGVEIVYNVCAKNQLSKDIFVGKFDSQTK
ncbi:MAG: hypothetical protein A2W23_01005 [Planctomycetes bacterium RBG_16_43_13]|nr:MAG: hypothetical protein A2W23_01005 [Planctomycetes bacterium RBG_16_43_13]